MKIVDVLGEDDDDDDKVDSSKGATSGGTRRAIKKAYNSAVSTDLTSNAPNESVAFETLNNYAGQIIVALNAFQKGNIIWKGVNRSAAILLTDPTKIERTAANTYNYTNLLVSTLPSWKGFPPRNKSLICATTRGIAGTFGKGRPYIVLPFGNPIIGECKENDFWNSFDSRVYPPMLNSTLNNLGAHLLHATDAVRYINRGYAAIRSNTADEFYEDLEKMDYALSQQMRVNPDLPWLVTHGKNEIRQKLVQIDKTFKQKLDELLDPVLYAFERSQISDVHARREVWLSSPAILVQELLLEQWIKHQQR